MGMSLTKTRAGLETDCCRYLLRYPQLRPGHSLKWDSLGPCIVKGRELAANTESADNRVSVSLVGEWVVPSDL